jgi:hypothetical protein
MGRRYTVREWFNEVGKPIYDLTSINYVYACCRGEIDPRNQRRRQLPEGWKSARDETLKRVFIEKDCEPEEKIAPPLKRTDHPSVKDNYANAQLDQSLISELEKHLREAILYGLPRRLVVELLPEPVPVVSFGRGISSKVLTQSFFKRVGRIFNEHGQEIEMGSNLKSNVYFYDDPSIDQSVALGTALSVWWTLNAQAGQTSGGANQPKSMLQELRQVREILKENYPHRAHLENQMIDQLEKRCIWCGVQKRKISSLKRRTAKSCSDEHRNEFHLWIKRMRRLPETKWKEEFRLRLDEISMALAT